MKEPPAIVDYEKFDEGQYFWWIKVEHEGKIFQGYLHLVKNE